jgi:hypothetical protein
MTTYTQEEAAEIHAQRDKLARCVTWAVNFMKTPGGGMVMRRDAEGNMSMEAWLTWFRRELASVGITWDDELLDYSRASKADRKRMLKESPTLQGKLDALNKSKPAPKTDAGEQGKGGA